MEAETAEFEDSESSGEKLTWRSVPPSLEFSESAVCLFTDLFKAPIPYFLAQKQPMWFPPVAAGT